MADWADAATDAPENVANYPVVVGGTHPTWIRPAYLRSCELVGRLFQSSNKLPNLIGVLS